MQTFRTYTTLPYTIPLTPLVSVYFHLLGLLVYSYEYMLSANYFVYNESITPPQHSPTHPSGICLFPSLRSSMPTRTSTCSLQTEFIYNGPNMQTFSIYTTLPYTIPLTPPVSVYFHLLGLLRLLVRVHALCKLTSSTTDPTCRPFQYIPPSPTLSHSPLRYRSISIS